MLHYEVAVATASRNMTADVIKPVVPEESPPPPPYVVINDVNPYHTTQPLCQIRWLQIDIV